MLSVDAAAEAQQRWRPVVHFAPARNWLSDPNGLVAHDGLYHLFFQCNPGGDQWGNMSWGHAVSADLLSWKELGIAIAADTDTMIFSGSVVVDTNNTAGFAGPGETALVAIYTGVNRMGPRLQTQQLAYSIDGGRTWRRYPGNPVLDIASTAFRDPKVFWHAPSARWVMAVAMAEARQVALYGSADLKRWEHLSDFGPCGATQGIWECPELFAIRHADHARAPLWMMKIDVFEGHPAGGSGAQYFIGDFDGRVFHASHDARWVDHGACFYASQTWYAPAMQPPRWLGWMGSHHDARHTPTVGWRGVMSTARELAVRGPVGSERLVQRPVLPPHPAHARCIALAPQMLEDARIGLPVRSRAIELVLEWAEISAADLGVTFRAGQSDVLKIGYSRGRGEVFVEQMPEGTVAVGTNRERRHAMPYPQPAAMQWLIVLDACSVELFVDDGEAVMTELFFPCAPIDVAWVHAGGGAALLASCNAWNLAPHGPPAIGSVPIGVHDEKA